MGIGGGGGGGGMGGSDPDQATEPYQLAGHDQGLALRAHDLGLRAPCDAVPDASSLSADDTYSVVAYLLFKNGIIQEDDVMDAKSLPKVQMPRRAEYKLPPKWKPGDPMRFTYRIDPAVKPSGSTSK